MQGRDGGSGRCQDEEGGVTRQSLKPRLCGLSVALHTVRPDFEGYIIRSSPACRPNARRARACARKRLVLLGLETNPTIADNGGTSRLRHHRSHPSGATSAFGMTWTCAHRNVLCGTYRTNAESSVEKQRCCTARSEERSFTAALLHNSEL